LQPSRRARAHAPGGASTTISPVLRTLRLRRPISLVLALALLLASTLGLVHGTLHAPGLQGSATTLSAVPGADPPAHANAATTPGLHAWLLKLFDHHDGSDQCRLYDQLSGGCSPPGVPLVLAALALPSASFAYFLGHAPLPASAPFEARAPPTSR
jgi:hypothetical protein